MAVGGGSRVEREVGGLVGFFLFRVDERIPFQAGLYHTHPPPVKGVSRVDRAKNAVPPDAVLPA
jgi:hypothetical protein